MRPFLVIPALGAFISSIALASNVVDLTATNFDEFVGSGKPALVTFLPAFVTDVRLNSLLLGEPCLVLIRSLTCVRCGHW